MLRSYQHIMLGERRDSNTAFGSLAGSDKVVLVIICIVVIAFGVYPKPLNDIAEESVKQILLNLK